MTPEPIDVQFASNEDIDEAVGRALTAAGVTLDQLREQARASRFTSERARTTWFVISPFVAHS
jgi:hypothetical protein